jgi:hypothetical protein
MNVKSPILFRTESYAVFSMFIMVLILSVISSARADSTNPGVYSVDSRPYGMTMAQWSKKWWNYFVSTPQPSPNDVNSRGSCAPSDSNPNVWFLNGAGSGTFIRRCTIPTGKALIFQPAGNECSYAENPSLKTESELRACAVAGDKVLSIHVSVDGKNLQNLQNHLVQTPLFDLTLPEKNIFGAPPGPTKAVSHAYLIVLQPLSLGNHKIHFDQVTLTDVETGTNNFAYDVTYQLTIK